MYGLKKILFLAAVFIIEATTQWQLRTVNGNPKRQRRFGVHNVPSQLPPSQQQSLQSQQWNDYPSRGQWNGGNSQTGYQQQQLNRNLQHQQRHHNQNLVDYPFTVEYVDRRAQQQSSLDGSMMAKPRKRVGGSVSNDENLVDYPFTIEYVNNMNHLSEKVEDGVQASMRANQDSFQLRTQQQRYQQNNQRRHFVGNHNGDPSLGGHLGVGRSSFLQQWN